MSVVGYVKKVDRYQRHMWFTDGRVLSMDNLISIEGELFKDMDG